MSVENRLAQHLAKWGLREFFHERDYYAWQRQSLPSQVLHRLNELAEHRQGGINTQSDREFYDLASSSNVLPVLYSQRFGYYRAVGAAIAQILKPGKSVLDVGCGVGILTTWYASLCPSCVFTGLDRSAQSISVAQQHAQSMELHNVSFQTFAIPEDDLPGKFDVIISTHALFQSETDPGLPSRSWESFDRDVIPQQQRVCETRTGIGDRLDWLLARMSSSGQLLAFEKASHLGRRALFQRALAARGLWCEQDPVFLRYVSMDEQIQDGPLYALVLKPTDIRFREAPIIEPMDCVYRCQGSDAELVWSKFSQSGSSDPLVQFQLGQQDIQWQVFHSESGLLGGRFSVSGAFTGVLIGTEAEEKLLMRLIEELAQATKRGEDLKEILQDIWSGGESSDSQWTPLYENHFPSAQRVWQGLTNRVVQRETTQSKADGQQYHVELGRCAGQLAYLYWANTFDQRQLVVMEVDREEILHEYFSESAERND